jgi:small redox-active disulfide protein 2
MIQLLILGTGCPKCNQLTENTQAAAQELGLEYELEKVTDINEMMKFGVMMTPALIVNNDVKFVGKVPSREEIKKMLI